MLKKNIFKILIFLVLIPRIELESDRYQRPVITIILYQLKIAISIEQGRIQCVN